MIRGRIPAAVCFLASLVAPGLHATGLPTVAGCFVGADGQRSVKVTLEVARKPHERRRGLMERKSLPRNHGMLFVYPSLNGPDRGFWMYNTLMPLDIAYLDPNRHIVSIRSMAPCPSGNNVDCPTYPAGEAFQFAVEMRLGYYEDNNLTVGDRLIWGDSLPEGCADSNVAE